MLVATKNDQPHSRKSYTSTTRWHNWRHGEVLVVQTISPCIIHARHSRVDTVRSLTRHRLLEMQFRMHTVLIPFFGFRADVEDDAASEYGAQAALPA